MGTFSIGEAYRAGFGLVARKPLHVLVWGVVYTLLRVLPYVLMVWLVGPDLFKAWGDFVANAAAGGDPGDLSEFTRTMQNVNSFESLGFLTSILAAAIFNAAVFRTLLRPSDGGFLGLKLGMDELWQGLLYLVMVILGCIFVILAALVGVLAGGILFFIGKAVGGNVLGGFGIALAVIATLGVVLWVIVRFSLAGPATFANRSFQLFESWTLTKGNAWGLFGLTVLLIATILAAEIVLGVAMLSIFVSLGSTEALSPDAIEAFFQQPADVWMLQATPWLVGGTLVGALLSGAIYTILMAPYASAYAQLTATPAPASAV
ncbi:MAG: hypothetical protein K1X35_04095 [Caulobacteraceae bacterium]|nr:hypothetical protein [Caulobacteraceae bacterium]